MPDRLTLQYEQQLANAHRALYKAYATAEQRNDDGAAYDLWQLLQHVTTLQEASLKGRRAQTRLAT